MSPPGDDRLQAYLAGEAIPEEVAHVEGCPVCAERLDRLAASLGDLESPVRGEGGEPD
jgi:hypothetical protein